MSLAKLLKDHIAGNFVSALALALAGCTVVYSAPSQAGLKLVGSLAGSVQNTAGIPQLGATIALYDRYERMVSRTSSDLRGQFSFDSLPPDIYSVRVSLASFMPALKRNISVLPGMRSALAINLASALSSIELVSTMPASGSLMSEDWKWVLRSTMTTRPVLRALEEQRRRDSSSSEMSDLFSDTTGLVRVASGEAMPFATLTNQPELGTSFALATSVAGNNRIRVTGNIGYSSDSSVPTAAFRTSFSKLDGLGPEYKLTVRQWSLPQGFFGPESSAFPSFRSASLSVIDDLQLTDDLTLEYGSSVDSITFLDRVTYLSPFARLTYRVGSTGQIQAAYSNGAPPVELLPGSLREGDDGLQQDLAALSLLPRVSKRNDTVRVQRTEAYEIGYTHNAGDRVYMVSAYRERIGSGAVTVLDGVEQFDSRDLLPELNGNSAAYSLSRFVRQGVMIGITQQLSDDWTITAAAGLAGALQPPDSSLSVSNPSEVRDMIRVTNEPWVILKLAGVLPGTGTRFHAGYQFMDTRSLAQPHVYVTNSLVPEPGLNIRVRQPIPGFSGMRGRLEATAELRNLLEQGYVPVNTLQGRRLVLTNYPRALRGGLSFIF
jgi:hypothetical protein